MTRLLEKFGVKKMNQVAWVDAQSLFLALFWHR